MDQKKRHLIPMKRRQPEVTCAHPKQETKFRDVIMYLVERRMGKSRRMFLTSLARSKGFCVEDTLSDKVTHIIAEANPAHELWSWLHGQSLTDPDSTNVLDISWFTESMEAGRPVLPSLQLKKTLPANPLPTVSQYACQRRTTLDNHNKVFTDALEVLIENYEFSDNKGACVGFRRAASVLKSLPKPLRCLKDMEGLPCLGDDTKAIIEVLYFHSLSLPLFLYTSSLLFTLFTSVFGVGPKTGDKWYRRGLRALEQVHSEPSIQLNKMQAAGTPLIHMHTRTCAPIYFQCASTVIFVCFLPYICPRGKEFGHDVDFLLSIPEPGKEDGLLPAVIDRLRKQGILLYSDLQESTLQQWKRPSRCFDSMDHFQKCFLIVKLWTRLVEGHREDPSSRRDWKAVRVDLVVPPVDCYAFALLGWSGSTQFERDLRRFARLERRMLLDNHALYDKTTNTFLQAKTEEDIFAHLGLDYIEPWQRNA
uniref:BRCT domain-containing protein n=1 Tax=Electrophorus electricus TaxID=8005 RepID=A0A4W4EKP5_ELEEL